MNDIWETVWDDLSETFQRIVASLGSRFPEMSWTSGHNDNRFFPFRAYAALNSGRDCSEDVIASIDFRRRDGKLYYSADIGFDDGEILADGPSGVIDVSNGLEAERAQIHAAVNEIKQFLMANEFTFRNAIEKG